MFSLKQMKLNAVIGGWRRTLMWPKRKWSWAKTCTRQPNLIHVHYRLKQAKGPGSFERLWSQSMLTRVRQRRRLFRDSCGVLEDDPNWAICPSTLPIRQLNLWSSITALLGRRESGGVGDILQQHIAGIPSHGQEAKMCIFANLI